MPNVTIQHRMFVPRRRRIGGGAATINVISPYTNSVTGYASEIALSPIEVPYPPPAGKLRPAYFMFWSVRGSAEGEFTQSDPYVHTLTGAEPMTATAWYCLGPSGEGGEHEGELETDAFLVSKDEFVEPTPIESVAPPSAWDHSDDEEFVFSAEASEVFALDSVVDPSEHFERWYSFEGDASGDGKKLQVPAKDGGIAIATYRVPPTVSPPRGPGSGASIWGIDLGGVIFGGEGLFIVNGVAHHVEPHNPFLAALAVYEAAAGLPEKTRVAVQSEALGAIEGAAKELRAQLPRAEESESQ